jgi:hypothetical protein
MQKGSFARKALRAFKPVECDLKIKLVIAAHTLHRMQKVAALADTGAQAVLTAWRVESRRAAFLRHNGGGNHFSRPREKSETNCTA